MLVALTSAALPALAAPPRRSDGATASTGSGGGSNPWLATSADPAAVRNGRQPQIQATQPLRTFGLNRSDMQSALADATTAAGSRAVVWLPTPAGTFRRFEVQDSPVMMPQLAAEHPEIRTYVGRGLDDTDGTYTDESVRLAMTPLGFTASVRGPSGAWYVDPLYHLDASAYASYFGRHLADTHGAFVERDAPVDETPAPADAAAPAAGPVIGSTLRTYRLAVLTDPSFADYWGAANVLAGLVTNLNRVEQIYNDELDVRLLLVDNEPKAQLNTIADAFEPNGPCGAAACFAQKELEFCGGATLGRNRIVLGQLIGAQNYDAGHVTLSNDGGGIAALGVVGGGNKALGCTGIPEADGDYYTVDYWAHEMGHNWSMNHTFGGDLSNCAGGNRNDATAVEPGSASSIMGYAGICQQDNLQPHSDPYFSQRSYEEAQTFMSAHRANVNEVQTVALEHFGGGDEKQVVTFSPLPRRTNGFKPKQSSFRIEIGGTKSVLIGKRGVEYTDAGIQAAINDIAGFAGTVAVTGTAKTGFTVVYLGASANRDVPDLSITNLSCGGCYSAVDEGKHGGAPDSFALSYAGSPASRVIAYGPGYTAAGVEAALHDVLPAGATATVAGFGGAGVVDNTGFQVTFGGTLGANAPGGAHVATLKLTNLSSGTSGHVAKTAWGGPALNGGFFTTPTGNAAPVTTAPARFTIPYRTPFALTGRATDPDGDTVTYMWEQNDAGTGTPLTSNAKSNGPLFRQFGTRLANHEYDPHAYGSCAPLGDDNGENCVTTDPTRVFPDLRQILAGDTNAATGSCAGVVPPNPEPLQPAQVDCFSEWLPTPVYTGPMHFRLTARDGHPGAGGISSADTTVNLAPGTGPFVVTSQANHVSYVRASKHTIAWDVAGTNHAPIGTTKVDILFSRDGGKTFTPLLRKTANDGSQAVTLPNIATTHARIEVRAVGSVFFAVNGSDFSLTRTTAHAQPASRRVW